jgi:hypothetical protein
VQLFDKNHDPAFRLGSSCTVGDLQIALPDLIFDDDSAFSLADGERPFNLTSFAPSPGQLSAFNGENAQGTWTLEVCNTPASASERETIFQNGDFESGDAGWTKSSTNGRPLIHHISDPSLVVPPQSGEWLAWLGGVPEETSSLKQNFVLPPQLAKYLPNLRFWYQIKSEDTCGYDFGELLINDQLVNTFNLCASGSTSNWSLAEYNLADWSDFFQQNTLEFRADIDDLYTSSLYVDSIHVNFANPGSQLECWLMDFETAAQEMTSYNFAPAVFR